MANKALLLFLVFQVSRLNGFTIQVINNLDTIVAHKCIEIQCLLNKSEQGIFARLQFSVDHPTVHLLSWQHDAVIQEHFIARIKKTKRLITKSFTGQILFHCPGISDPTCTHIMKNCMLYVSGFSIDKQGIVTPFVQTIRLSASEIEKNEPCCSNDDINLPTLLQIPSSDFLGTTDLSQSFCNLDKFVSLLIALFNALYILFFNVLFLCWYIPAIIITIMMILKRSNNITLRKTPWMIAFLEQDTLTISSVFLAMLGTLYQCRQMVSRESAIAFLAVVCIFANITLSIWHSRQKKYLTSYDELFRFFLAIAMFPLLVYVGLVHYGYY